MMDDVKLRPEWSKAVYGNEGRLLIRCPGLRRLLEEFEEYP